MTNKLSLDDNVKAEKRVRYPLPTSTSPFPTTLHLIKDLSNNWPLLVIILSTSLPQLVPFLHSFQNISHILTSPLYFHFTLHLSLYISFNTSPSLLSSTVFHIPLPLFQRLSGIWWSAHIERLWFPSSFPFISPVWSVSVINPGSGSTKGRETYQHIEKIGERERRRRTRER